MIFRSLLRFAPLGLLLLRLMIGIIFVDSGWEDLRNPEQRSQSIGQSRSFTIFLGTAEILGGAAVVLGIWPQLAALGLILVMMGSIYEKIFVWHTGFWGEKTYGWHYDLVLVVMNLVVLFTNGGPWVVTK
jgi:putative oxidoreductase